MSSIFSLIPSPPAPFFVVVGGGGERVEGGRTLVMLDGRHAWDSWPNNRDLAWEVPRKKGKKTKNLKIKERQRTSDRWRKKYLDFDIGEMWARHRAEAEWEWLSDGVRQKEVKDERCRTRELWEKVAEEWELLMRRVYQLFRCRLLIKHHQTLNLLTINTLLHYRAFSSPSVFTFISLFLFPSGSLPLSLCRPLFPFLFFLSLYQTPPNASQINYLMHLSLSARAQKQFAALPIHRRVFSQEVEYDTWRGEIFLSRFFFLLFFAYKERPSSFFHSFLVPLSLISPELIKLQSICCKRLICWFPRQT